MQLLQTDVFEQLRQPSIAKEHAINIKMEWVYYDCIYSINQDNNYYLSIEYMYFNHNIINILVKIMNRLINLIINKYKLIFLTIALIWWIQKIRWWSTCITLILICTVYTSIHRFIT